MTMVGRDPGQSDCLQCPSSASRQASAREAAGARGVFVDPLLAAAVKLTIR
jgi:hypothetical protein